VANFFPNLLRRNGERNASVTLGAYAWSGMTQTPHPEWAVSVRAQAFKAPHRGDDATIAPGFSEPTIGGDTLPGAAKERQHGFFATSSHTSAEGNHSC
jgi:hypothetical protein